MPTLKIHGVVSKIIGNKIYMGGHHDSLKKLNYMKEDFNIKTPITDNGFYIIYYGDIDNILGKKITAWVRVRNYNFISLAPHNSGKAIQGWNLIASAVKLDNKW